MPKLLNLLSAICFFGLLAAAGRAQMLTPVPPDEAVTVATEEIRLNVTARDAAGRFAARKATQQPLYPSNGCVEMQGNKKMSER
jgi:hypothetical protein